MKFLGNLLLIGLAILGLLAILPLFTITFAVLGTIAIAIIWFIPIWIIATSNKTTGFEKIAWLLAMFCLSWFAWVFYFFLAPIKEKYPEQGQYRDYDIYDRHNRYGRHSRRDYY